MNRAPAPAVLFLFALFFAFPALALPASVHAQSTYAPTTPTAANGDALTSGTSSDDSGVLATSSEFFAANQPAGAGTLGNPGGLWWVISLGALAIIGLGWLAYRELA